MKERECYDRDQIKLGQIFERNGEIFRVLAIADEPTVDVENLATGERNHYVITCPDFAKFRKIDEAREKRKTLCEVVKNLLAKLNATPLVKERSLISSKISFVLEEIEKSES